jgi:hypothetical protein
MATQAGYAATPRTSSTAAFSGTASTAGWSQVSGTPNAAQSLFVAGASGSRVAVITAQGGNPTVGGSIVLWRYNGTTSFPFDNFLVPAVTPAVTLTSNNAGAAAAGITTFTVTNVTGLPYNGLIYATTSLGIATYSYSIASATTLTTSFISQTGGAGTITGQTVLYLNTPWQQTKRYPMLLLASTDTLYATSTVNSQLATLTAFGGDF